LKIPVNEPLITAKYYGVNRYAELSLSKERNKKKKTNRRRLSEIEAAL